MNMQTKMKAICFALMLAANIFAQSAVPLYLGDENMPRVAMADAAVASLKINGNTVTSGLALPSPIADETLLIYASIKNLGYISTDATVFLTIEGDAIMELAQENSEASQETESASYLREYNIHLNGGEEQEVLFKVNTNELGLDKVEMRTDRKTAPASCHVLDGNTDCTGVLAGDSKTYAVIVSVKASNDANPKNNQQATWISIIPKQKKTEWKTETLKLKQGWNLVSAPVENYNKMTESPQNIVKIIWHYDTKKQQYVRSSELTGDDGYWVYAKQDGELTFWVANEEKSLPSKTYSLFAGWNIVGNPFYGKTMLSDVAGSCKVTSGPWGYDQEEGIYRPTDVLASGLGVWIKVEKDCQLYSGDELPPNLPIQEETIKIAKQPTQSNNIAEQSIQLANNAGQDGQSG